MSSTKVKVIEEYNPELDALSPKLKTMDYPGALIMTDVEVIVFSYTDLDILFNRVVAAKAKTVKRK